MPYYRAVGEIPRKRHTQFRRPDGGLYAEELMGEEGFSTNSSLLYHVNPPTAIVKSEGVDLPAHAARTSPNHPLLPRHFKMHELTAGGDPVLGRRLLLANEDVRISYVAADTDGELYRNSVGDECVYVEAGRARLESAYGPLDAGPGDYVVIPTGTIHRFVRTDPAEPLRLIVFEASGHIRPPKRYLSQYGQLLEHAPYSERDLRGPAEPLVLEGEDVPVLVRTRAGLSRLTYRNHPLDVVGWDGCLYPFAFNIADFEPIVKRTHAPPPVHQTFEGPNFVICSFCPRPLDFDEAAIPIPYNHHNVDSDEVMFYVAGDYTARRGSGIDIGSISLHPSGFTHGPAPGAVEGVIEAVGKGHTTTTETAVMIDTFRPLNIGGEAFSVEASDYAWSWAR